MPELERLIAELLEARPGEAARAAELWCKGLSEGEAAAVAECRRLAAAAGRPADAEAWWLGYRSGAQCKPDMGFCKAGQPLPANARYWCRPGAGEWVEIEE